MSDFKSKLPDLKELGDITGKLFQDIKTSVFEIMANYKEKRATSEETETTVASEAKPKKKPAAKATDEKKPDDTASQ